MKALVTGGTGFVGSHIVRALGEAGHTACVLHRPSSKLDALTGLEYQSALGDILDVSALEAACQGCDWVFHVAAVADYWRADHSKMMEANVEGTRRVLKAARAAGVKRVVFTSSAATVGLRSDGQPSNERVAFNLSPDHFPYGYSKVLAERAAQEAVAEGQDVVIVNPVVVMGPCDLNMISGSYILQIKKLARFIPVPPGGIAVIDVRDVAKMHLAAAEYGRSGERYILNTANYSQREWMGMIADVVGVPHPFVPAPAFVLPIAASIIDRMRGWGIQIPIDGDQTRLGARNIHFDGSKAWAELGEPQVDMLTSLQDTYRWYQENDYL